jgi:hypothetical protein
MCELATLKQKVRIVESELDIKRANYKLYQRFIENVRVVCQENVKETVVNCEKVCQYYLYNIEVLEGELDSHKAAVVDLENAIKLLNERLNPAELW